MVLQLTAFHIAILMAGAAFLIAAAINDARSYRIPNVLCLSMLLFFPLFVRTAPHSIDWQQNLMVSLLVLLSGFAMFMGNLAGAGDIKLLAVTSLWVGPHYIAVFIVTTAIAGGFVALSMAGLTHHRNKSRTEAVSLSKVPIPYGIAIAAGGIYTFGMISRPLLFPS